MWRLLRTTIGGIARELQVPLPLRYVCGAWSSRAHVFKVTLYFVVQFQAGVYPRPKIPTDGLWYALSYLWPHQSCGKNTCCRSCRCPRRRHLWLLHVDNGIFGIHPCLKNEINGPISEVSSSTGESTSSIMAYHTRHMFVAAAGSSLLYMYVCTWSLALA